MAWRAIYEDLQEFPSETTNPVDLPRDGLQAVVVNNKPYLGFECCAFGTVDGKEAVAVSREDMSIVQSTYPTLTVVRGKTCSTRQFHQVAKRIGAWSPLNIEPFRGWEKDVVGWRVWFEKSVFDSVGLIELDWLNFWASLPSTGVQGLMLYENWFSVPGQRQYRQVFGGGDYYVMAPSPYGPIFLNTYETPAEIERRYPGAIIKTGTLLPDKVYQRINAAINASVIL